jgi:predicted nucleic acid-binding protein
MTGSVAAWVVDTSTYTHLSRAGHLDLLRQLAPGGSIVVPAEVDAEIQNGRDRYPGIVAPEALPWVEVKAALGGGPLENLGECAVIACALHRGHVALLDDRAAMAQADLRGVQARDTLWVVIEAYATVFGKDRDQAIAVVDALLGTDMYLPIENGTSLIAWAWEEGLLRD